MLLNKFFSSIQQNSGQQEEYPPEDTEDGDAANEFEVMDPDIHIELENLKLEELRIQEEKLRCKQRLAILKQADKRLPQNSSRQILPNGQIIFRTKVETRDDVHTGAGDSLKIPGLQRSASRQCVSCGGPSDMFCARCGVTPYCSEHCQRRDWNDRHRAVCHNLARLSGVSGADTNSFGLIDVKSPVIAPLRRPRSPDAVNGKRSDTGSDKQVNGTEKPKSSSIRQTTAGRPNGNRRPNGDRADSYVEDSRRNQEDKDGSKKDFNRNDRDDSRRNQNSRKDFGRKEERQDARRYPNKEDSRNRNSRSDDSRSQVNGRREPVKELKVAITQDEDWGVPSKKPPPEFSQPREELPEAPARSRSPPKSSSSQNSPADAPTEEKPLVPDSYILQKLSPGDIVVLSAESDAAEHGGLVCLAMHESYAAEYDRLCDEFAALCEASPSGYAPPPGAALAVVSPEDGGWYRARCTAPGACALLDAAKLLPLQPDSRACALHERFANIPEFACLLKNDHVQIGAQLKCTILSKTADGFRVSLESVESGASLGEGHVSRWLPTVEYPPAAAQAQIPEVPRPVVRNNSKVLLVDMSAPHVAIVRSADDRAQLAFENVLQEVVHYGRKASPLSEPPKKGDTVIARFSDGELYRALVKRTNVKQDKYLIEYIEYCNVDVAKLADIYPCPPRLTVAATPAITTPVRLGEERPEDTVTPPAATFVEQLKDKLVKLILTIPSGAESAPKDSVVCLTVDETRESLNEKLADLCAPDWRKREERGAENDTAPVERIMYSQLSFAALPPGGCTVEVQDTSSLKEGVLYGYPRGLAEAYAVFGDLTEQINRYCESSKETLYVPIKEEVCFAKCPPYANWFRAVVIDLEGVTGVDLTVHVCYVDHGNMSAVPPAMLRRASAQYALQLPAIAINMDVRDFPKHPSQAQIARAVSHMKVNEEGRGVLHVSRCEKIEDGFYIVEAPELLAAIN